MVSKTFMMRFGLLCGLLFGCLAGEPYAAMARAEPPGALARAPQAIQQDIANSSQGSTPATGAALLSAADRKIYREAFAAAKAKRFGEARALAQTTQDPRLRKVVLWLGLTAPEPDQGGFPIVATFLAKNPDWPGRGALQRRAEKAMPEDMTDAQMLSWFAKHPVMTAAGAFRHAEALARAGRAAEAAEAARTAWVALDFTDAEEANFLARFGAGLQAEHHRARLERLLWQRAYRPARRQAQRLGRDYTALAEARLALAGNRPGVDSAIKRVPQALRADPGLIYERARWRLRRNRYDDVIALLDPPDPALPEAKRWWRLRHRAARQALAKGDISVAYRIAAGHGMTAGIGFAEAEWLAGWIALRFLNEPGTAYDHFTRLHAGVSSPVSRGRGAFWAGEAARERARRIAASLRTEQAEEPATWRLRAHQWYATAAAHDTSFYGQLASRRLGRDPEIDLEARSAPTDKTRKDFSNNELVQIIRLLSEVEERTLLERFHGRLRALAKTAQDYALAAGLANEIGRPDLAMRAARAARGAAIVLPGYLFPNISLANTEPPETALLLALIRQESGFYSEAVSRAGARGLMQIMPATARQVARRIKVAYNGEKLLSDPQYNLLLGRSYLSRLLDLYGGSYVLALAAYNAGPARADRWIKSFGDPRDLDTDTVDWIESIPFNETRNYVQRVLESVIAYRQRLGKEAPATGGLPMLRPLAPASQQGALPRPNLSCCL